MEHRKYLISSLIGITLLLVLFSFIGILSDVGKRSITGMAVSGFVGENIYYVDATNGNDDNDGLSETSAWKTISKVNDKVFSAGEQILFKRGEVWNEQLDLTGKGEEGNPVLYGAYGGGEMPIINVLEKITEWTSYPDNNNIWEVEVEVQPNGIFFDDEIKTGESAIEELNSEKDWYWDSNVLYVYSSSGSPETIHTNSGVEVSTADHAIGNYWAKYSYIIIEDLHLIGGNSNAVTITYADNHEIRNCLIEKSTVSGIVLSNNEGSEIHDCTIQNNGHNGIWITYKSHNTKIYNNIIQENGLSSIGDREAIGVWNSKDIEIYENEIIHKGYGESVEIGSDTDPTSSAKFYQNFVDGSDSTKSTLLIYGGTYEVYNNIFISNSEVEGVFIMDDQKSENEFVKIDLYNNVIYGAKTGILVYDGGTNPVNDVTDVNIKNNILSNSVDYNLRVATDIGQKTNIDYNFYDNNDGKKFAWNYRDYYGNTEDANFAEWQIVSNQDANSIIGDPLFINKGNLDFHLQENSPAIDTGECIDYITEDYEGNSKPSGNKCDIGAFEYQIGLPPEITCEQAGFSCVRNCNGTVKDYNCESGVCCEEQEERTCQDEGGDVCLTSETCNGTEVFASDGECCLGECIVISRDKTCSEQGGKICGDNEYCNGSIGWASDGSCCLDSCVDEIGGRTEPSRSSITEFVKDYGLYGVIGALIAGIGGASAFLISKLRKEEELIELWKGRYSKKRIVDAEHLVSVLKGRGHDSDYIKELFIRKGWPEDLVGRLVE